MCVVCPCGCESMNVSECVFVCVCGMYAGIMYRMLFAFTLILFFKKLVSL